MSAPSNIADQVAERIRSRIEAAGHPIAIRIGDETVHASSALPTFYEARSFLPTWSRDEAIAPAFEELIYVIGQAKSHGLTPEDYHWELLWKLRRQIEQGINPLSTSDMGRLADFDLLTTDAYLVYGSHILMGKTDPSTLYAEWIANRRGADLAAVLRAALRQGQIAESLQALAPPQQGYSRLRKALETYRAMGEKKSWPRVNDGPKLQKGDRGERIVQLRARLLASGDFQGAAKSDVELFDDHLEQAVRRFQQRHGLETDGVVGTATLSAVNKGLDERIRQIEVNLERWRWLPQELGSRYVLVNIADFRLDVVEEQTTVLTMRVITGRAYRKTPVFSDLMTYLVLNPYWNVPQNIAVQDKLPLIKKDPEYLANQKMRIFQGWGADAREIDPKSIDWSNITERNFDFRLRQDPGPLNALGQVKFMFPNRFNVYLHDTPSRELFERVSRTFSSGCIRIQKPIDLAAYLLEGSQWTGHEIQQALTRGAEQTIALPAPIPVHLLYWTAWVNEDGTLQLRNDIYDRDERLATALLSTPSKR